MGVTVQMTTGRRGTRTALLAGAVIMLASAVACRSPGDPAGPEPIPGVGGTGVPGGRGAPPPAPSSPPPPLEGRGLVFIERAPYYGSGGASRLVLYSDTIVVLRVFGNEYRGIVRGRADFLTYDFGNPWNPWRAFGSRRGDTLSIAYDTMMLANDFVSGDYIFDPGE